MLAFLFYVKTDTLISLSLSFFFLVECVHEIIRREQTVNEGSGGEVATTLKHLLIKMTNRNNNDDVDSRLREKEQQDKLLFHDFLGSKTATLASTSMLPLDKAAKPATASASSAGGRGGLSSTSDLGSSLSLS